MAVKARVRNLGAIGIIKDIPPFDLPTNAWTDGLNVRFKKSHVEKMGGRAPAYTARKPPGIPLACLPRTNTEAKIYATGTKIYRIEGDTYIDSSRLKAGSTTETDNYQAGEDSPWSSTNLSNAIVLTNKRDNPQGLVPNAEHFIDLPGWGKAGKADTAPKHWTCNVIRSYKNYLVALNMVEEGVELPQRIRWSNVAEVNNLPPDWIQDDETKDGGFNDLSDCRGALIDGLSLRDSFVVYTDKETYTMDYVGGTLIFQFKKLFSDSGILAQNCAVEFEGQHFVISRDDIFTHNGSVKTPIASNRIKQYLIEEISSINPQATRVIAMPTHKEIWVCYVSTGAETSTANTTVSRACNKAAIWNWEFDTWTFYDLPNIYDITVMTSPDTSTVGWDDFSHPTDEWDDKSEETQQWKAADQDFARQVLYCASEHGCLYVIDYGGTMDTWDDKTKTVINSNPVIITLERTDVDFDDVVQDVNSYKLIKTITPQIYGSGTLNLNIGGSEVPNSTPNYSEYQTFDVSRDHKYDVLANYRYIAIKFTDQSVSSWKFAGYDIDLEEGGLI